MSNCDKCGEFDELALECCGAPESGEGCRCDDESARSLCDRCWHEEGLGCAGGCESPFHDDLG